MSIITNKNLFFISLLCTIYGFSNKPPEDNHNSCTKTSYGLTLGFPDFVGINAHYTTGSSIFSLMASPSLPYTIQVEYDQMVLTQREGVQVENPALTIDFDGKYGPQFGLQWSYFPWASSFHIFSGLHYREISLKGSFVSNLIIRTNDVVIETNSSVSLAARAKIKQHRGRVGLGWLIRIYKSLHSTVQLGWEIPLGGDASVDMTANLINPQSTSEVNNEVLEEAERSFEADLETQSISDVRSVRDVRLPILQVSFNYSL